MKTHHKKSISLLLFTILSLMVNALVAAPRPMPSPPKSAAKAYLLQDFHSGQILAKVNADQRVEPASLTKLMTAYIIFEEINAGSITLEDKVLISEKAWQMGGSRMFVEVGKHVSVENLLKGMIIQSGNDATVALAEYIAGSDDAFATLMNHHAERLGMKNTHFVNSTGMPDPNHWTTANDLALLTRAIILNHPEYYKWYSIREFTFNDIVQKNRNKLLWRDKYVDGVKTGHTESAGYCLITSALRDDMRLISVVLGTKSEESRAVESQKILNYGFRFFETHRLFERDQGVTSAPVWKGEADEVPLGVNETLYITVPRGRFKDIDTKMDVSQLVAAPVSLGDQFGSISVTLDGEYITTRPLIALQNINEGGLLKQLKDELMLLFQ